MAYELTSERIRLIMRGSNDAAEWEWDEIERLALSALRHEEREGWVSVPREPTEEMVEAGAIDSGITWVEEMGRDEINDLVSMVYTAMLRAAEPKERGE